MGVPKEKNSKTEKSEKKVRPNRPLCAFPLSNIQYEIIKEENLVKTYLWALPVATAAHSHPPAYCAGQGGQKELLMVVRLLGSLTAHRGLFA